MEREKGIEPSPQAWEAQFKKSQVVGTAALPNAKLGCKWKTNGK
jgi:hypothetical protein